MLFRSMAALVILRNMMQGIQRRIAPLFCSALELLGKVIFALWVVPAYGYPAVCVCEPVTWVVCFLFISGAAFLCRREFRDGGKTESGNCCANDSCEENMA